MRILTLCNKIPFPAKDGYSIAVMNLANAFSEKGNEVRILAMNTSKHPLDEKNITSHIKKRFDFRSVRVNNKINAPAAFIKLVQNRSYNVSRFVSKKYDAALKTILAEFKPDLVQLEGLYLTPYIGTIRNNSTALISLRAHNVEHLVWQRNSEQEKSFVKKVYLKVLAKQLKRYESDVIGKCDLIVPVTNNDAELFLKIAPKIKMHVSPVSFDDIILKFKGRAPEPNSLFFIGTLDWLPNLDGLSWFLENVWKDLSKRFPESKFYIAGKNMPPFFTKMKLQNVFVVGEVKDAYEFMGSKHIMIAPLFSGGGMRVKIIEAMALGKTIISTSVGAEGIEVVNGKNILIANDAIGFIAQISNCLTDTIYAHQLGEQAALSAGKHYSVGNCANALLDFYSSELK